MNKDRTTADSSFGVQAETVLDGLRKALRELIATLPGEVHRPADLQRLLNLDAVLSWRIYRTAAGDDLFGDAVHVPGRVAMGRFFRAAEEQSAPAAVLRSAEAAYTAFERLVGEHAGDRTSFASMVSSLSEAETRRPIDLQHRRAAYRAQSHIWGVQAQTQLSCTIVNYADGGDWLDLANVRGHLNVRRLRPGVGWPVTRTKVTSDDFAKEAHEVVREPIDPRGVTIQGMAPLMDYCSQPLPSLRVYEDESKFLYADLKGSSLGNRSRATFLLGDVMRRISPVTATVENRTGQHGLFVAVPTSVLIFDMMVRRGLYANGAPTVAVRADHPNRPGLHDDMGWNRLPMAGSATLLGQGVSVLRTADVPRYVEMAGMVFGQLRWPSEDFDVWRCRIDYPVMPSLVSMHFPLRQHNS